MSSDSGVLRHVRLTTIEMQIVSRLAERGGEERYNRIELNERAAAMIASMIDRGVLVWREGIYLRLTDIGCQIAEQIERMKVSAASGMSSPAEETKQGDST